MPPMASSTCLPPTGAGGVVLSVAELMGPPRGCSEYGPSAVAVTVVRVIGAGRGGVGVLPRADGELGGADDVPVLEVQEQPVVPGRGRGGVEGDVRAGDRKSTRLNSSHANISYAV